MDSLLYCPLILGSPTHPHPPHSTCWMYYGCLLIYLPSSLDYELSETGDQVSETAESSASNYLIVTEIIVMCPISCQQLFLDQTSTTRDYWNPSENFLIRTTEVILEFQGEKMTDSRTGAGNMKDDPGAFCFVFIFLVGGKLFYNIVLVSALQPYTHKRTHTQHSTQSHTHHIHTQHIDTHTTHTQTPHTHTHHTHIHKHTTHT